MTQGGFAEVERYIASIFEGAKPSSAHLSLSEFPWATIFTVNYDRLVEDAYHAKGDSRRLHRSTSDKRLIKGEASAPGHVELIKLHGCIDSVPDHDCPLILTTEQYADHQRGRAELFIRLRDAASRSVIVFIGTSLTDQDIIFYTRQLPIELRSPAYLVAPNVNAIAVKSYENKGISVIKATFVQFMDGLEAAIPKQIRDFAQLRLTTTHPIETKFAVQGQGCSLDLTSALASSMWYLSSELKVSRADSGMFFMGASAPFEGHEADLVIRRDKQDDFTQEILSDANAEKGKVSLIIGPAGAGKSVLLQSIARELATDFGQLVLFVRPGASLNIAAINEVLSKTTEPVILFLDNAADYVDDLQRIYHTTREYADRLNIVLAERANETYASKLDSRVSVERILELRKVSTREATLLLLKLRTAGQLGKLASMSEEQQLKELTSLSGARGDMLVAVYNSTHGASLEEMLLNEYEGIATDAARRVYLTICTLHRLNERVRAGSIHRIHGISYDRFLQDFLGPLKQIIFAEVDDDRDIYYRTRHPVVADIVFERVLVDEETRLDVLLACIDGVQSGYPSDDRSLGKLVYHDSIRGFFENVDRAHLYIDKLLEKLDCDGKAFHQAAVYEFTYGNDLDRAERFLRKAKELEPSYPPIDHSECHVMYLRGSKEEHPRRKSFYLKRAEELASKLVLRGGSPYPYDTLIRIYSQRIATALNSDDSSAAGELLQRAEELLSDGMERYPDDHRILDAERVLSEAVGDDQRTVRILLDSIKINPRRGGVARALSRIYRRTGQVSEALSVLENVITFAPKDRRTKFALAEVLLESGSNDLERIRSLVESCRSPKDAPRVEVLFGRVLFQLDRIDDANRVFREARQQRTADGKRWRLYPWHEKVRGQCTQYDPFAGAWFSTAVFGKVFVPRTTIEETNQLVRTGMEGLISVSFNYLGPVGTSLTLIN